MPPDYDGNGWGEWKRLVLDKLEAIDRLDDKIDQVHIELAALKIKAGAWGAVAGFFPALAAAIIWLVSR